MFLKNYKFRVKSDLKDNLLNLKIRINTYD